MTLSAGMRLGAYEIESLLGAGGMGEVYTATDTRLGRRVAIKILPAHLAADPAAVARFEQEARAVAALSHPNILAIHDVGRHENVAFAVMELLDGETLRDRLAHGRIPLKKALDYASQLAQGLAAAHARGILHRDIKPENIFVTADGHLKILDFGLAKIAAAARQSATVTEETRISEPTEAGTVLGTAGYLSPEQAEARPVDHRSDIFSFGAVLYEMATGARAFKGNSTIDTLHRIVHGDPAPIDTLYPDTPSELKWVLAKCLAKDPEDRYQSTRDLVVDLKNVSRFADSSSRLTATAAPSRTSSSRSRRSLVATAAVLAVALIVAATMFLLRGRGTDSAAPTPSKLSVERITASGDVIHAVISPDGKYVSYVLSNNGRQSLWIRQLATASALQIVPPATVGYWGSMFTPDGSAVDYVLVGAEAHDRALFRVPVLGGTPRRLLDEIASFPVFSPDGRQMAFMREGSPEPGKSSVWIADADGGQLRMLAARQAPEFFVPIFFTAPAWSPDGTLIVCPMQRRADKTAGTFVAYRVSDGVEQSFPHYEWPTVGQAAWTPDGRGLVAIGADATERNSQLWWISAHEISRRKITNDLLDYRGVSVTADGTALVTVASDATSSIWVVPLDGAGAPSRISNGRYDGISGVAAVSDGRVVYRSLESGSASIWVMGEDGNGKRQVTTDGVAARPAPTADGQSMVFVREGSGLWSIDLDGRNGRLIPGTKSAQDPVVTPDRKWVFFVVAPNGTEEIWKAPLDGSAPAVRAVDALAFRPAVSSDGTQLAFFYRETPTASFTVAVMPIGSAASAHPTKTFATAPSSAFSTVRWTLDGTGLLLNTAQGDRANIWLQPLAGGALRQVTHFVDQAIMGFDRSADGKRLIVARGVLSRDAILLRNFR